MRALACLVALLLAGCAESPTDLADPPQSLQEAEPPPTLVVVNASAPPPDPLLNLTQFHWSTDAALGDTAFSFTVDFGGSNDCQVEQAVTGHSDGRRRTVFFGDGGWSSGSFGATVHVAAGPVDTDDVLVGAGGYGSASSLGGTFGGVQTFTRVATDVAPIPSDFNSGQSLSVAVECDAPFALVGARIGHEVLVGDADTLGIAASVSIAGGVGLGSQSLDITANEGHVRFGSFGDQAGSITLATPQDSQDFELPAQSNGALTGGPGTYQVTAQRVGVAFEAYWHVIYATPDVVDLRGGIRETPAYRSPF